MIRVLVVDDHPIVREGLSAVLEDQADFQVVGATGTVEEAVTFATRDHPDVILLDLELPGTGGNEAIPRLAAAVPHAGIIIFTAYDTDERVLGAIRAGARGYLLKGVAADEIARAVRAVHGGGSHLTSRIATKVMAEVSAPRRGRFLTAREHEVLRLVADGQSTKQIARSLAITERTVKFHVASIFNKLGVGNRAEAVARAVRRGLL
ncbi:MAG: response regulator [Armatimonadota bacterium]